MENRPIVSHTSSNLPTDVDINLCLLEYLLRQAKCEATTEKTLLSSNVTSCSSDSCASDVQVNQNSPVSSEQTSVSENNSSFPESDDSFTPTKSLPDSLTNVRSIKESNGHLSLDQSDSEVSTYGHLSNEEGIVKSSRGPDTREAKQLEDSHQLQSSTAECNSVSSEENSLFPVNQKTGMQTCSYKQRVKCGKFQHVASKQSSWTFGFIPTSETRSFCWTSWEHFKTIICCKFRGKWFRNCVWWFWECVSSFAEEVLWTATRDQAIRGTAEAEWRRESETPSWPGETLVPWRKRKALWKAPRRGSFAAWVRLVGDVKN